MTNRHLWYRGTVNYYLQHHYSHGFHLSARIARFLQSTYIFYCEFSPLAVKSMFTAFFRQWAIGRSFSYCIKGIHSLYSGIEGSWESGIKKQST
jgi:hypothetical protein